jgi:hypothetical protein
MQLHRSSSHRKRVPAKARVGRKGVDGGPKLRRQKIGQEICDPVRLGAVLLRAL